MKGLHEKRVGSERRRRGLVLILEQKRTDLSCTDPPSWLVREASTEQVQGISRSRGEEVTEGSARELSYRNIIWEFSVPLSGVRTVATVRSCRGTGGKHSLANPPPSAFRALERWFLTGPCLTRQGGMACATSTLQRYTRRTRYRPRYRSIYSRTRVRGVDTS